ncbi:hypothetical protein HDU91_002484, partial [Kappamyces sp. JEL0680]
GSIHWMAPEVARGKGYSAKVDIWSCGCLVLEMLTGQVPWHKVRGNIIYLLGTGNSPPLPSTLSDVSKHFLEVTFEIDPEKRPTATRLLGHVFTDVDLTTIDFYKWSTEAMQLRLEQGSTSEEVSADDSDDSSESEDDLSDEEDIAQLELDELSVQELVNGQPDLANGADEDPEPQAEEDYEDYEDTTPLPKSPLGNMSGKSHLPKIELDIDLEDDLYDFNGPGFNNEVTESLEYLLALPENK